MKRTIATTIILSLVMCLFMAFPASACTNHTKDEQLLSMISMAKSHDMGEYKYAAFFGNYNATKLNIIFSKTPILEFGQDALLYTIDINGTFTYHYDLIFRGYVLNFKYGVNNAYTAPYGITLKCYLDNVFKTDYFVYNIDFISSHSTLLFSPLPKEVSYGIHIITEPIDPSALQALLSLAKSTQNTGYTQSSWNALQSQITAAESLLASTGYTQSQIDSAKNALQAALDGLVILPDTSELQALLSVADAIQNDGYSKSTWNLFASARSASHSLIASSFYTASDISASKNQLQTTMDNLTLLPDSSFLESLIEQAQTYIDDKYTELSLQILNSKIMQAIILLEDKDYVSSQIDKAISELQDAIINLVLLTPPEPEPTDPPPIVVEGQYKWELNEEQKKYANLIDGVKPDHLNPVKEAVEDNMSVARGYGFWIWFLVLVPLILVIITRGFLRDIGYNINLDMTHKDTGHIRLTAKKIDRRGDDIL